MKHSVDVSRETLDRLDRFAALLATWNRRINLVSQADVTDLWSRHITDSLQLLPYLPPACPAAIDVGSGAGFPGLILSVASGVPFTLIEADARKAAFLREAARITDAPATILVARAEAAVVTPVPLITARALAPLPRLLDLCVPHLAPGGSLLLLKGANVDPEIADAERTWTLRVERHISQTNGGGVILRISDIQRG